MRKLALWLFALAVLATPIHAGGIGPMLAHWDTRDAGEDQGGGVRLTVDLGPDWNLELRLAWFDAFFQVNPDAILFKHEAFPIDAGLSYGFDAGDRVHPYVGMGVSYVDMNTRAIDVDINRRIEVRIPDEVGIFFLAGLDVPVNSRITLFVEAIQRNIKTTANSTDVTDFNVDMSGIGANAGLMISF